MCLAVPFVGIVSVIFGAILIVFSVKKKKDEQLSIPNRNIAQNAPKSFTEWMSDPDEMAEKFLKYYRDQLEENDDYYLSAKELKEDFAEEKVYMYEPLELEFRREEKKIYAKMDDKYYYVGSLKKDYEKCLLTLYLYPNIYKYVGETIEKEKGDPFFGVDAIILDK